MVRLLMCIALLVGLSPARAHPPPVMTTDQEKAFAEEIVAWRRAYADVVRSKDAARLRDLYAPSFVHTDIPGHQSGRDKRVAAVLAGEPVIELAAVDDLVIRVPGGWTAVATGRSTLKSATDGRVFVVTWMAVYVRAGDGWQLAASQASRLRETRP